MTWRSPPIFNSLPFASWPSEALTYAFALGAEDWVKVVIGVVTTGGGTIILLWGRIVAVWEKSAKGQLGAAQRQIAENALRIASLEADAAASKDETREGRERLKERDAAITARDKQINDLIEALSERDRSLEEKGRQNRRLVADTADLAESILVLSGNAKPKGA